MTIRKAIAAALTGVATWGITAQPDGISGAEWWGLFGVLVGAALVWLVPNETTVDVAARIEPHIPRLGIEPDDIPTTGSPERGAVSWGTVALVVMAVVLVLWAIGEVPR